MGRFLVDTFNYRKAYGKAGPLREAPYKRRDGPYGKGRSSREAPYRGPYGQTALREGPLRGGFLREGPLRITGKLTGTLGKGILRGGALLTGRLRLGPYERALTGKEGPEGQGLLHPFPRFRVI